MIDSCSQSTACGVNFAKDKETEDSESAKLWGIQDQKIEAHGKKIVMFHGQTNEAPIPASIKVDVSDVSRNVASMGNCFELDSICISRIVVTLAGWKMEVRK